MSANTTVLWLLAYCYVMRCKPRLLICFPPMCVFVFQIYRRHRYPSSTLVCLITACCDGPHRLNIHIQSTRRLPAGHGVNSIPLRSKTPFHRRSSVGQKLGRWSSLSEYELACLCDSELTAILDRLIPARTVRCRRRTSDP